MTDAGRFAPGTTVRVRDDWPERRGPCHIRTPHYLRGRIGTVERILGRFANPEDLAFAEDLARRAALAIGNADLFSQTQRAAETLQHALLPQGLPDLKGWDVAALYQPSGRVEVGGDFFDVIGLGRYAPRRGRSTPTASSSAVTRTSTPAWTGSALCSGTRSPRTASTCRPSSSGWRDGFGGRTGAPRRRRGDAGGSPPGVALG